MNINASTLTAFSRTPTNSSWRFGVFSLSGRFRSDSTQSLSKAEMDIDDIYTETASTAALLDKKDWGMRLWQRMAAKGRVVVPPREVIIYGDYVVKKSLVASSTMAQ